MKPDYKVLILSCLMMILLFLFSCTTTKVEEDKEIVESKTEPIPEAAMIDEIEILMAELSVEEKVGQIFVVRPDSIDPKLTPQDIELNITVGVTDLTDDMISDYARYPAGGFALFQKNIKGPDQIGSFNEKLHKLGKIRPLIFIDEEGGLVARLANSRAFNLPKYKSMGSVGSTGDYSKAYEAGASIGTYLKKYGFDVDFAPVADVNTNPDNPVIGTRAFSSNPEVAGEMCVEFVKGLNSAGVRGTFKHYPGHGDTNTDTHFGYAETSKNWEELVNCELIPFKKGIENNIQMIMVAHITVPEVEKKGVPSTISSTLITDKLRNELGFDGIVISDAMEMKAITAEYSDGEAAVLAIMAGVDIVLMPYDYRAAFDYVIEAVKKDETLEKRINESVRRILKFKSLF